MSDLITPTTDHRPDRPDHARVSSEVFWEHCKRCFDEVPPKFNLRTMLKVPLMGIPAIMAAHGLDEGAAVAHILAQFKEKTCRDMSAERTAILYACCWVIRESRPPMEGG